MWATMGSHSGSSFFDDADFLDDPDRLERQSCPGCHCTVEDLGSEDDWPDGLRTESDVHSDNAGMHGFVVDQRVYYRERDQFFGQRGRVVGGSSAYVAPCIQICFKGRLYQGMLLLDTNIPYQSSCGISALTGTVAEITRGGSQTNGGEHLLTRLGPCRPLHLFTSMYFVCVRSLSFAPAPWCSRFRNCFGQCCNFHLIS
jgi:hypothetical protein